MAASTSTSIYPDTASSKLEECFLQVVKSVEGPNEFDISLDDLYKILKQEIVVDPLVKDVRLRTILPYMLLHHINNWPGWMKSSQLFTGKLAYHVFYERFKRYLDYKMKYLIKNDFQNALKLHNQEEQKIQTAGNKKKKCASFKICIEGKPNIINTMVFCDLNDSIVLRQHSEPAWENLNHLQLINWPHVEVVMTTNDFQICRRNMHEFQKYLTYSVDLTSSAKTDYLEQVEFVNPQQVRTSYSLKLLNAYFAQYISLIQKHASSLTNCTIEEVQNIVWESLGDIIEIDVNSSMASNTAVLFNIGKNFYSRNKKMRAKTEGTSVVCFSELITPKVQFALNYFKIRPNPYSQKVDQFKNLKEVQDGNTAFLLFVMPTIKYKCLYCDLPFKDSEGMLDHLKQRHCMEQPIICGKCKQQCSVPQLASNRWRHNCPSQPPPLVINS